MSKLSIGTWLSLPNESIAEIFANAGYEWIVIDLEHSTIGINQAEQLIRVIDLAGSKPFVRLSSHDSSQIKRVLDAGAAGVACESHARCSAAGRGGDGGRRVNATGTR